MVFSLIVLAVFAALALAAALCDAVPAVRTWLLRIGIGSLTPEQAREKMRAAVSRQVRRMPAVPVGDGTRFTLPERLRGTYKSRKVQSWQRAALLLGAAESLRSVSMRDGAQDAPVPHDRGNRGDEGKLSYALLGTADDLLTQDGRWKRRVERVDEALLAYALLRVTQDPRKVRPAMDETYALLTALQSDGTVPYDPHAADRRFVDTVGMICPFLWLYGETYNVPQAKELCMRQLEEYRTRGLNTVTGLPAHAFRLSDGAALGIGDWGRGCGWYALALAELLRCGADVTASAQALARAVIPLQQKNGAWSRQLLSERGIESTATAMLGHLCAVLYAQTRDEACAAAARKAKRALLAATRKNGETDYAQGDTKGIGFYSARLTASPAATGFALLLTEELP